jgi:hypothetical protein
MSIGSRAAAALALVASLGALRELQAQTTPRVYFACYVPLTGTVYRIKEPDVKPACTSASHVEFSWTDGAGAVRVTDALGGDLSGVFSNASVVKLLGRALATTPPSPGQFLAFDGTAWTPTSAPSGGVTSHGALTGLLNDDHPQYLLTEGLRASTNGFAVSGVLNTGSIPATGAGVRLMWYPGKAAFRAGRANPISWEDSNVGIYSVALGFETTASGAESFAFGHQASATGSSSIALGDFANASYSGSIALSAGGRGGFASAPNQFVASASGGIHLNVSPSSFKGCDLVFPGDLTCTGKIVGTNVGGSETALGSGTTATGVNSTAMGSNAVAFFDGSFAYGDNSTATKIVTQAANQFAVRAQRIWLGTTSSPTATAGAYLETSTGAFLSDGGAWTNSSDVNRKHLFENMSGEDVLSRLATLPVRRWSYRAERASVRHLGPTAQDFYSAFHLGGSQTSIATVDADGVSLLANQALEKRTRDLQAEIARLRTQNAHQAARLDALEAAIARLEAAGRTP